MKTMLEPLVKMPRNAAGRASWYDSNRELRAPSELFFDLGLEEETSEEERSIMNSTISAGNA